MFIKKRRRSIPNEVDAVLPLPEFRQSKDLLADIGKRLRDRYDALRPHSDTKHWR